MSAKLQKPLAMSLSPTAKGFLNNAWLSQISQIFIFVTMKTVAAKPAKAPETA